MGYALANLDNGLFFDKGKWTACFELAEQFEELDSVASLADRHKVRNAAAAFIDGEHPGHPLGFYWLTEPNSN